MAQVETGVSPALLIEKAHQLIDGAVTAYRRADAYAQLGRFTVDQASIDWGTVWGTDGSYPTDAQQAPETPFPVLLRSIETLSHKVTALQVLMTGFASTAYASEIERAELFGMPAGKTAFRNIAEYLRDALKIPMRQARARLKLSEGLAPLPSLDGGHVPEPPYPDVARRFFSATINPVSAEIVVDTIQQAQRAAARAKALTPEITRQLETGQADLAEQATTLDPDGLRQVVKRWSEYSLNSFEHLSQPDDEVLARKRGAFYRGQVHGLHSWMLRVDSLFHERLRVLASVINSPDPSFGPLKQLLEKLFGTTLPNFTSPIPAKQQPGPGQQALFSEDDIGSPTRTSDERSREPNLLDGITAVLDTGMSLASTTFPTIGGLPAQLSVILDYETLYNRLSYGCTMNAPPRPSATNFISQALFTGPISPSTIRPLSCEAELIPAVLGTDSVMLDMGRKVRLFTPDQRRALITRERGCAAPSCAIPSPWCDAHHVIPWKDGGSTSVANAVLLCSHHHHAVHAGMWTRQLNDGIAWFTPAPYLDPDRRARRNRFWR